MHQAVENPSELKGSQPNVQVVIGSYNAKRVGL